MTDRIERTYDLDGTPSVVWDALTDPAWLSAWLAEEAELDLRPGGDARFVIDGRERTGWVEEVVAPTEDRPGRLSFWWQEDDEPATRVAFELEETTRGTRLHLVETRPLDVLDLVGIPLRGTGSGTGGASYGPVLVAA